MKKTITNIVFKLLGRNAAYRFGRALYMCARGDFVNDTPSNGEMMVQDCVLQALKNSQNCQKIIVFDVGANVGEWSLSLLRKLNWHSMETRVCLYSFEPVPSTAETLKKNLGYPKPNLQIEEIALSSSIGKAEIYVAGESAGTNSLHDDSTDEHTMRLPIALTTTTDFCQEQAISHVHLLKCDTEGHDMNVILGSLPLLKQERITVFQFEYNHRWVHSRSFIKDVFVAVQDLPYKIAKVQPDRIFLFNRWHPEIERFIESNYLSDYHQSSANRNSRSGTGVVCAA